MSAMEVNVGSPWRSETGLGTAWRKERECRAIVGDQQLKLTLASCKEEAFSEGSYTNNVDSGHSDGVVCVRSESTSSEGPVRRIHLTRDIKPTLFLEYH